MKLRSHFKKARRSIGVVASSLVLALVLGVWVRSITETAKTAFPAREHSLNKRDPELTQSLLLDSILSIIQSYYVDEDRVDNKRLLDVTLYKLTEDPELRLRTTDEGYVLSVKEKDLAMKINEPFVYKDLLDHAVAIASFLSQNHSKKNRTSKWANEGGFRVLNAMLAGLDPHSALLDPSAYSELRQGTEGAFGGVGVVVGVRDNLLTVIKPLPRSPAARLGINKHDRIMRINDVNTYGVALDDLVEHMRGVPGSAVRLSLLRDGALSPSEVVITREVIQVDSVESELINQKTIPLLHLTIESFSSRTAKEVKDAILNAERATSKKLGGVILDLRSNPGGLLDQAVQVSDLFLRDGRIVSTIGRREEAENAASGYTEFDYPVAILINGESASASEIVAGALQDNDRAVIIGQPSFGKGSVQTIFELPGDQALKLTIARYYTPRGRSIQNIGIMPNIWLQPVKQQAEKNINLLGSQRYKSEGFLLNHLESDSSARFDRFQTPDFKAYFLEEPPAKEPARDEELKFAVDILTRVGRHYGVPTPPGTRRAGHWLAVAGDVIKAQVSAFETTAQQNLRKKFDVDWTGFGGFRLRRPQIAIDLPEPILKAVEGETVKIPWTVRNASKQPIHRVSAYLRSDSDSVNTYEVLIGKLAPGEERSGHFEFPLYMGLEEDALILSAGLAVDAIPIVTEPRTMKLEIQHKNKPDVDGIVTLDDNLGIFRGKLEPSEKALLRVRVINQSKMTARNIKVRLVNLSGQQIKIDDAVKTLPIIGPGGSTYLSFSVTAAKELVSPQLTVGLELMGEQMADAVRQYHVIESVPNTTAERISNLIGR